MVVVDTCVLSSLAKICKLDLLREFFDDVVVVPSVADEVERVGWAKFARSIKEVLYFEKAEDWEFVLVVPLSSKELQYAYTLKNEYGLSIADSECIAVAKIRKQVLLSDDKYLGRTAVNEGVEHVYDLLTFLEACIVKGILRKGQLTEIVSLLKKRDFYKFSDDDEKELFSYFE